MGNASLGCPLKVVVLALVVTGVWIASPGGLSRADAQGSGGTVTYYGQMFCGEEFVFCLDRSASMSWGGQFETMIAETTNAISSLSPTQSFSLVSFSDSDVVFSPTVLPATSANIIAATQWLAGLTPSGSTCLESAVVQSLAILDTGFGDGAVVLLGDGVPSCSSGSNNQAIILANVLAANTASDPIYIIYLASDTGGVVFYQLIAVQNPGTGLGCPQTIRRGDANGDSAVDLADAIRILDTLFGGSTAPVCEDAGDTNDDGAFEISDAIMLLSALFSGGAISAPYPDCGVDPTPDLLPCTLPGNCP